MKCDVKIIEYRDNQAYADLQQAAADLTELTQAYDAQARPGGRDRLQPRQGLRPALAMPSWRRPRPARARAMASSLITARMKVSNASEAHGRKAKEPCQGRRLRLSGNRSGPDGSGADPRRRRGRPFPADAVFGYEVVDDNPADPAGSGERRTRWRRRPDALLRAPPPGWCGAVAGDHRRRRRRGAADRR
ncbi:MAG: hypothetical protein MZW92_31915 [Comamonadaceae bacterium]|nr:hypothetical protein [Comamonadaceae bacterium]